MLHGVLGARFSDAQCGFKALRADVARQLLPLVADTGWFFDTELLVIAERAGLRIHEVPVDWVDDPDSRVDIVSTAINDLKGCWRVGRALATGALPVRELQAQPRPGAAGTGRAPRHGRPDGAFRHRRHRQHRGVRAAVPVVPFRDGGAGRQPHRSALTAIGNTAANRAFTFRIRGRTGVARHQLHGLLVFAFGLAITSGSLFLLHRYDSTVGKGVELSALVLANLVATLVRFVALRRVFGARS